MIEVTRRNPEGRGQVATLTKIGWVLGGPLTNNTNEEKVFPSEINIMTEHTLLRTSKNSKYPLLERVENFWNTDCLGINPNEASVYGTFLNDLQYVLE